MTDNNTWANIHQQYKAQDWINKPSLFAEMAIGYFPSSGNLLELGAGQGQDSRYFAEQGYQVVSTDLEDKAVMLNQDKMPATLAPRMTVQKLDIRQTFPFADNTFSVVYAHLSLHYFDTDTTHRVSREIHRVLKPDGVLAFLVNSTSDPEYGSGDRLEPDYFEIEGMAKRFFDVQTVGTYTEHFTVQLLDDQGETYKDRAKGVHNLIRFIGRKKAD